MGNRLALREIGLGAFRINVYPLTVLAHLGKGTDARLVDREPITDSDLLAFKAVQFLQAGNYSLSHDSGFPEKLYQQAMGEQ